MERYKLYTFLSLFVQMIMISLYYYNFIPISKYNAVHAYSVPFLHPFLVSLTLQNLRKSEILSDAHFGAVKWVWNLITQLGV